MNQDLLRKLFKREQHLQDVLDSLYNSKNDPLPADEADYIIEKRNIKISIYLSEIAFIKEVISDYINSFTNS